MPRTSPTLNFGHIAFMAVLGAVFLVVGLLLPAHWKSLDPVVLERAGRGTPTVAEAGMTEVVKEKPGPATLLLAAAESAADPKADKLSASLSSLKSKMPELVRLGGRDASLSRILPPETGEQTATSVPAMDLFLPEAVRHPLRERLQQSPAPGVASILATRELTRLEHFVPVRDAGGQAYEATVLLTGYLYEGEKLAPSLAQELKGAAEKAAGQAGPKEWEGACLDLLALGRRLDWTQFTELLRNIPDVQSLNRLATAARSDTANFPLIYAACLMTQSSGSVAEYVGRFGKAGTGYLATALPQGRGALDLLLKRQVAVGPGQGRAMAFVAPVALKSTWLALGLKALCFVLAMTCFFLVWQTLSAIERVEDLALMSPVSEMRRVTLAVSLVVLLMVVSEPFFFSHARAATSGPVLNLPMISNSPISPNSNHSPEPRSLLMHLDLTTILSVALFAALQVIVYAICLMKIQEIDRQSVSPQLKLRLLENEENLFDSGLYVGIAGTAAALILQVLQVIEANLLAAYASNLFGILCVAFVKIRHVRSYKRTLILQSQRELEREQEREREMAAQSLSHVTA